MELILHPDTEMQLEHFMRRPSHAVLLEGLEGSGKGAVSTLLASKLLGLESNKLATHPYFLRFGADNKAITIDSIRSLHEFVRLKVPGQQNIRRVIVIEKGENLTIEAQNAFLKLLEEPPVDTVIIVTSVNHNLLLPTVASRLQLIKVKPLPRKDINEFFSKNGYEEKDIIKAYYISNGQFGLMKAVLEGDNEHDYIGYIKEAKRLLGSSAYLRLQHVDQLSKQKEKLSEFLTAMQRLCRAALSNAAEQDKKIETAKWYKTLRKVNMAQSALNRNAQPKLVLTDLLINL